MITVKTAGYNSKSAIALRDVFSDGVEKFMESHECKLANGVCENCDYNYPCSNLCSSVAYLNIVIDKMRKKELASSQNINN